MLLQLRPCSSPHRARPAWSCWASPNAGVGLLLHLVWDQEMRKEPESVVSSEKHGMFQRWSRPISLSLTRGCFGRLRGFPTPMSDSFCVGLKSSPPVSYTTPSPCGLCLCFSYEGHFQCRERERGFKMSSAIAGLQIKQQARESRSPEKQSYGSLLFRMRQEAEAEVTHLASRLICPRLGRHLG